MATFRVGRSSVRGGDRLRSGSVAANQVAASATLTLTRSITAAAALRPGAAASLTLARSLTATASLRPAASATLTLTRSITAAAGNWANATTISADVPEALTLRRSLVATAYVEVTVTPPPTGSVVAPIKRVSITMPAPTLDANGRPT